MALGKKLKDIRIEKGLSQTNVADHLNVTRQSVSKWENNTGYPDLDNLSRLSEYYEFSIDELLKDSHDFKPRNHTFIIKYKDYITCLIYFLFASVPFFQIWTIPFSIYSFIFAAKKKVKYNVLIRIIALTSILFFVIQILIFLVGLFNLSGSTTEVHVN